MIGVKKSPPIEDGRGGRKNSGVRGGATRVQMTRWGEEKQKKTKKKMFDECRQTSHTSKLRSPAPKWFSLPAILPKIYTRAV